MGSLGGRERPCINCGKFRGFFPQARPQQALGENL